MAELLELKEYGLTLEDFGAAVVYDGRIVSRVHRPCIIRTDSSCWGYSVYAAAGNYVRTDLEPDPVYLLRDMEYVIDSPDGYVEVIGFSENDPGRLAVTRYSGEDEASAPPYTCRELLLNELEWHREGDSIIIDNVVGDYKTILIPDRLMDLPVTRVELDDTFLPQGCETFLVSKGVQAVDVRFDDNFCLTRLEIPDSVELLSPPDQVCYSFWFLRKPAGEPVYLCRYYCGTPEAGRGADSELLIQDGTIGIAGCADFRNYWHHIRIPDSVRYIGSNAFFFSYCLEELRLSETLENIGASAFLFCERLRELSLPNSLTGPTDAFQCCRSLEKVWMPASAYQGNSDCFPNTPEIHLHDKDGKRTVIRDVMPEPILGRVSAFSMPGPFIAGGCSYNGVDELRVTKSFDTGNYKDLWGRDVIHLRLEDPQIITRDGQIYYEDYWYIEGGGSLTQVVERRAEDLIHVWDDMPMEKMKEILQKTTNS